MAREDRRKRRERRRAEGRDFAHLLPHLLTTGNLAAGFYSITLSGMGELVWASVMIIIAGVFDGLDGRAARRAGATSRFGAEYDSISDTVSFGVAPAFLAYNAGALQELGWTGWVVAFLYTVCAALRLARFNVSPGRYRGRFEGLSSPSAAGMVLSSVLFAGFLRESGFAFEVPAPLAAIGLALVAVLMVSPIPYRSFKDLSLPRGPKGVVLMVLASVVMLSKPQVTLFLFGICYVSAGPIEWLWRIRTGRPLEELPEGVDPASPESAAGAPSAATADAGGEASAS